MAPESRLHAKNLQGGSMQGAATVAARTAEVSAEEAIARATDWLLSVQFDEGYWWGELEADTTLESDYILYLQILGQRDSEKVRKLANYIRSQQQSDGGWNIFYGGPSELNATIKAYVALRIAGDSASSAHLEK